MSFRFGKRSVTRLFTCDERLVRVAHRALLFSPFDFFIIEGHRSKQQQTAAYNNGKSKLQWPHSKHNTSPSTAMDLAPWPVHWRNVMQFHVLAGVIFTAAAHEKVRLRWGGDWDGDWSAVDQKFFDLPHFEILE